METILRRALRTSVAHRYRAKCSPSALLRNTAIWPRVSGASGQ
jgi:hypothetical protein